MPDEALNETVARAMGWEQQPNHYHFARLGYHHIIWVRKHPRNQDWEYSEKAPPYATAEPGTPEADVLAGEMMRWLARRAYGGIGADISITAGLPLAASVRLCGEEPIVGIFNKALARAVAAVAEKEGGGA